MNNQIIEAIPHHPEADSFDFQKSLERLKQALFCHKLLIAGTTVLTIIMVIMYMSAFPASYQAQVVFFADSPTDGPREEFYRNWNVFRSNALADEGIMMTSSVIVAQVVDDMELGYNDVYHSFMGHVGYLWVESSIGKAYRKVKFALFPVNEQYSLSPEEFERGKTIISFKDGIILQPVADANVAALIARGPSPRIADIVNRMADIYLMERQNRLIEEAEVAYMALKQEVDKAQVRLEDVEGRLETHYEENSMLLGYEKEKLQMNSWMELQGGSVETEAQLAYIEATLGELDRQLELEDENVVGSRVLVNNSARITLRDQIVQLQISLVQTKLRYSEDSPEVAEINRQIDAITELWNNEEENEVAQSTEMVSAIYQSLESRKSVLMSELYGVRAKLATKKQADSNMTETLRSLPRKINATQQLERERSMLSLTYTGLSDRLTTAAISLATIASAPAAMRIVDYAEYPERPYWPNKKLLLLTGLVLGLIMGVLAAIVVDFIYGRVSRYHLSANTSYNAVYAVVSRDPKFMRQLYALPEQVEGTQRKLLGKL